MNYIKLKLSLEKGSDSSNCSDRPSIEMLCKLIPDIVGLELRIQLVQIVQEQYDENFIDTSCLESEDLVEILEGLMRLEKYIRNSLDGQVNLYPLLKKIVPKIIFQLGQNQIPLFTFKSLQIISHILSAQAQEYKQLVLQNFGLRFFIKLLDSPHLIISNYAVYTIGQIAAYENWSKNLQDINIVPSLIRIIQRNTEFKAVSNCAQVLNKVQGKHNFDKQRIDLFTAISANVESIRFSFAKDPDYYEILITNCFQGLEHLSKFELTAHYLFELDFIPFVFELISDDYPEITFKALYFLKSLISKENYYIIDFIFKEHFITAIKKPLEFEDALFDEIVIQYIEKFYETFKKITADSDHYTAMLEHKKILTHHSKMVLLQKLQWFLHAHGNLSVELNIFIVDEACFLANFANLQFINQIIITQLQECLEQWWEIFWETKDCISENYQPILDKLKLLAQEIQAQL